MKARELRFSSDVSRVCMLIKITTKTDISAYDIVQNLFPDKNKDFVININETDIALVKEIRTGIDSKDLKKAGLTHCRYPFQRVLHPLRGRNRYNRYRYQGSGLLL